jgi:hypothetical protein
MKSQKPIPLFTSDSLLELLCTLLGNGASFRFRANGYSMTPTIRNGDIITVSPLQNMPPRIGEIVAFPHPENQRLTIHRLIDSRSSLALCRGDNRDQEDPPVPLDQIIGVVVAIRRKERERFWPNRFSHPRISRCYCRLDLVLKRLRRIVKRTVKGAE